MLKVQNGKGTPPLSSLLTESCADTGVGPTLVSVAREWPGKLPGWREVQVTHLEWAKVPDNKEGSKWKGFAVSGQDDLWDGKAPDSDGSRCPLEQRWESLGAWPPSLSSEHLYIALRLLSAPSTLQVYSKSCWMKRKLNSDSKGQNPHFPKDESYIPLQLFEITYFHIAGS